MNVNDIIVEAEKVDTGERVIGFVCGCKLCRTTEGLTNFDEARPIGRLTFANGKVGGIAVYTDTLSFKKMSNNMRRDKMSELVKLEDVKNAFNKLYGNEYSFAELREKLNVYDEDSADVNPVVHAKWENVNPVEVPLYRCSVCGHTPTVIKTNFCPNCGADMRGDN